MEEAQPMRANAPADRFVSLHGIFERSAQDDPLAVALEFHWTSDHSTQWTYAELNTRALTFANHIRRLPDFATGSIVSICLDRNPYLFVAVLGILKAGAAWCPIDPAFPAEHRRRQIERTGGRYLVVDAKSPSDG